MQQLQTDISKIVNGGYGLGRHPDGRIMLVRQTLPGESVTVTVEEAKKNLLYCTPRQILKGHSGRRTPPCMYYGSCGGCDLMHGDYQTQQTVKRSILIDLLSRHAAGALSNALNKVAAVLPSPAEFGYRQRLRLQVDKEGQLGFNQFRSHAIIAVERCMLAADPINYVLADLRQPGPSQALLRGCQQVEIQLNPATDTCVILCYLEKKPHPDRLKQARQWLAGQSLVSELHFIGSSFARTIIPRQSDQPATRLRVNYCNTPTTGEDLELAWSPGGFCQVNTTQNLTMIRQVIALSEVSPEDSVLDLYSGMGNFSLPLARLAKNVLAVEVSAQAVRDGQHNATTAELTNLSFWQSPTDVAVKQLVAQGKTYSCLVLDPPRKGAPGLAQQLAQLCSKTLVYVSCDPATLCRDLAELLSCGMELVTIQPLDMFPQTHHIETIALLRARGN